MIASMTNTSWIRRSISQIADIRHGFPFKGGRFNYEGRGYKLLTPANFHEEGGFRDVGTKQRFCDEPFPSEYLLPEGALLVVMTEQAPGLLGSSACVPVGKVFLHNQRLGLVHITRPEVVYRPYLYRIFNLSAVRKQISADAGGTKVRHTSPDKLKALVWSFPPIHEQTRIVSLLDQWDRAIDITERLIAAKQERHAWLMQQLLTGKRRLPGFTWHWRSVHFGEFLTESRLSGSDGKTARKITVKLYGLGVMEKADKREGSASTRYYSRKAGQFIYSKLDFLNGAFGLIPPELDGFESTLDLPCFDIATGLNPQFLRYLVSREAFYSQFLSSAMGGRKARRVNPSEFLAIQFRLPSSEEQAAIAKVIGLAERECQILALKSEALKEQKKGLMQQLLTGKRRVKVPQSSEIAGKPRKK